MPSEYEHIIENLKSCFEGKTWYGPSLLDKLNEVPWEIVNDQRYGSKSIAVLVQHILNWRIFVLRKMEGDLDYDLIIDGETDWTPIFINNERDWNTLIEGLKKNQMELLRQLAREEESILGRTVPGKSYTFKPILDSIPQHDIYHLGQIAMLLAMYKL